MNATKQSFSATFCIIVFGLMGWACSSSSAAFQNHQVLIDSILIEKSASLVEEMEKPACTMKVNIKYPKEIDGKALSPEIIKVITTLAIGEEFTAPTIQEAVDLYIEKYFASYRSTKEDYLGFIKEFGDNSSGTFNYEDEIVCDIVYLENNIFAFQAKHFIYTGGAHPNHSTQNCTIDLLTSKVIHQEDLFDEEGISAITTYIKNDLLKQYKEMMQTDVETLEDVGFFNSSEIVPNNNFLVTDRGITFTYNPYEIAPYAIGSPEVTIPYEFIKLYIKQKSLPAILLKD